MKRILFPILNFMLLSVAVYGLAPQSHFQGGRRDYYSDIQTLCRKIQGPLISMIKPYREKMCIYGSEILAVLLSEHLGIPVNNPAAPTRLELVPGFINTNINRPLKNTTVYHQWIQLVVAHEPFLFIDPTLWQFNEVDPEYPMTYAEEILICPVTERPLFLYEATMDFFIGWITKIISALEAIQDGGLIPKRLNYY